MGLGVKVYINVSEKPFDFHKHLKKANVFHHPLQANYLHFTLT